jgi:hypothetical protein
MVFKINGSCSCNSNNGSHTPIFWPWRGTSKVCPQRNSYKNAFFSFVVSFFRYLYCTCVVDIFVVTTAFCLTYLLPKTDPAEHTYSPTWKSLTNLKHEHRGTYDKTFYTRKPLHFTNALLSLMSWHWCSFITDINYFCKTKTLLEVRNNVSSYLATKFYTRRDK